MPLAGQATPSAGQPCCFKRETQAVRDLRPHDVGNSWIESTMEVRLGHFIDPAHQGGHPHGSVFGNGKL